MRAANLPACLQDCVGAGDQKEMVGQLVHRVGHLEAALWEAEKARRRLNNELVEIRGNIRVFCRLRPSAGAAAVEPMHGDAVRCVVDGKAHDFSFDRCAAPRALSLALVGTAACRRRALDQQAPRLACAVPRLAVVRTCS